MSRPINRISFSSHPFSSLLFLAVPLLAASGCTRALDMAVVDRAISDGINSQLQLPIATVSCPVGDRPVKEGDTFDCIATPKIGGRLTVTVTQRPGAGTVSWTVTRTEGLIDLDKIEVSVKDGLKAQSNVDATVACDGRWKAVKVTEIFHCQATSGDHKATIEVTTMDRDGKIGWKVQ